MRNRNGKGVKKNDKDVGGSTLDDLGAQIKGEKKRGKTY